MTDSNRRRALLAIAGAGLVVACGKDKRGDASASTLTNAKASPDDDKKKEGDVTATEDLMREHGVIRRVIVVYRESATRVIEAQAAFPLASLHDAAALMRSFAEDYHEKKLEEAHIFPVVNRGGGAPAAEVTVLLAQHQRGREITDYILAATSKPLSKAAAEPLSRALRSFARMYEEHTAREDTIVFPAWKKALSPKELAAMGDQFEDIEHQTFGKDGFDDAVDRIAKIERDLGFDPNAFTAPPPGG